MPQEDADETYSVIYAALKHPIRRRILRMLNDNELTYTQMLKTLDIDTGHLNYYLESLGELVAKNADGKYRLSEFGNAAVNLMTGIEETEPAPKEHTKNRFSRRKITRLSQVLSIVALLLIGVLLMAVSNVSTYFNESAGPVGLQTLQPNASMTTDITVSLRHFPTNTLTSYYKTFLQIEIIKTNVTLQVQVTESVFPMGNIPFGEPAELYFEDSVLIYNQTCEGPLHPENKYIGSGTTVSPELLVPVKSPQEKGVLNANSFANYNITVTNLGGEKLVHKLPDSYQIVSVPENGSFSLKTSYIFTQRTDYIYFYPGLILIVFASALAILPYLPLLAKRFRKSPKSTISQGISAIARR